MQTIRFEHLVLRPFEDNDAGAFADAVRESVQSVGAWMPWCHDAYTESEALAWFAETRASLAAGTAQEVGIFSRDATDLLGGAGLNQINRQHAFCNLGYWVRQSMQRRGVASRAVQALADHAFRVLQLNRVEIVVAIGNLASEGVARKSGARFECVARNRLLIEGAPVPASVFSIVPA